MAMQTTGSNVEGEPMMDINTTPLIDVMLVLLIMFIITIPPQTFDTPERQAFGEGLSYTPWHALPEHRPVGQVNEVRRKVYLASSDERHRHRGAPRAEPTGAESWD